MIGGISSARGVRCPPRRRCLGGSDTLVRRRYTPLGLASERGKTAAINWLVRALIHASRGGVYFIRVCDHAFSAAAVELFSDCR